MNLRLSNPFRAHRHERKNKSFISYRTKAVYLLMLLMVSFAHGNKVNGQITEQFNLSNSVVSISKTSTGISSSQGELIVGNAYLDQTWRGHIAFNISSIPSNATITAATLNLKCTQYTGKTFGTTKGTILLMNLSNRPTSFSSEADYNHLYTNSQFTSKEVTVGSVATVSGTDLNTKIKNSLGENYLYFGLVGGAPALHGFKFSLSDSDLYLSVTYTVPAPNAPTALQTNAVTTTGFTLSWTPPVPADAVTGYKIFKNNVYLKSSTTPSTTITGLSANTGYTFNVSAYNTTGESPMSNGLVAVTLPDPPVNLGVIAINATGCSLYWTAPTGTINSYNVYQNGTFIKTVTSTTAAITNLVTDTPYTFTVSAIGVSGESAQSSGIVVVPGPTPSAPTNLRYSNLTAKGCTISWDASSGEVTGYKLYEHSPSAKVTTLTSTETTLQNLTPGLDYIFSVKAYNRYGESAGSSTIGYSAPSPLEPPANLTASNVTSTKCTLSWTAKGAVTANKIYGNGVFVLATPNGSAMTVSNLKPNTTYTFTVTSYNAEEGETAPSNAVTVTTLPLAISPPSNLVATNVTTQGCTLSWAASSGPVNGYNIYRNGAKIQTSSATSAAISDLSPGTAYAFTVTAYYVEGETTASNAVTVNTPTLDIPAAPGNLTASNITSVGCTLSWTVSPGTVTAYNIYRNGTKLQTTTSTSINIGNLTPNTTYTFTVSAYNVTGESPMSNTASVNTLPVTIPPAPINLRLVSYTSSGCNVAWNTLTGSIATGFYVYVYAGSTLITKSSISYPPFSFSGTGTFTFYVSAYNSAGESPKSNALTVTLPNTLAMASLARTEDANPLYTPEESDGISAPDADLKVYPNPVAETLLFRESRFLIFIYATLVEIRCNG